MSRPPLVGSGTVGAALYHVHTDGSCTCVGYQRRGVAPARTSGPSKRSRRTRWAGHKRVQA